MKITKKTLKRIIAEEMQQILHEAEKEHNLFGGRGPDEIDFDDIANELEILKQKTGLSDEEVKELVKKELKDFKTLKEQATLLNEAGSIFDILFAVIANLFAEAGFHVATGIAKGAGSPHSGGSGGSGGSSDPDIDPTGDKVLDSNYAWQWSDDFIKNYKLGKLSPEQLGKLKDGAGEGYRDDGDMLTNYKQSKDRAAMQSSKGFTIREAKITQSTFKQIIAEELPEGKTKMKITKKTLKNIIAEELEAMLSEMLSPAQEYAYSRGQLKIPQSPKYEPPMETKYDRMSQDERRLRAEYDNRYPSAAEICRRVQYDPGSVTTIEDTECTNYNERKDAHVSAELAKLGKKMATEGKTKISRSTLKRIIAKELQSGRLE